MFITQQRKVAAPEFDAEVSVTAQTPVPTPPTPPGPADEGARVTALVELLVAKGVISEAELEEAMKRLNKPPGSG